jgi:hypothetical protein
VGLEKGPLSFMSAIDDLLGRKSNGSDQVNQEYGIRDP